MDNKVVSKNALKNEIKKRLTRIYADIEELPENYLEDFEVWK